jgi:CRISPR/Cas system-associated exonuclease Cas4 (RecB family)
MEESKKLGERFLEELEEELKVASSAGVTNSLLLIELEEELRLLRKDFGVLLKCKPDAILFLALRERTLRAITIEVAETDIATVLRTKHVLPRVLFYALAAYLYYGIPSVSIYATLTPPVSHEALALLLRPNGGECDRLVRLLNDLKELLKLKEPPPSRGNAPCHHCVYAHICYYRRG